MAPLFWIFRIIAVVALLCVAAAIATPQGRLPLALRGLQKLLRKDGVRLPESDKEQEVSAKRKFIAFIIVLLAAFVCVAAPLGICILRK